ncbi:MAG: hypothetical protein ABWZ75_02880 [Novosphingobium sp.]
MNTGKAIALFLAAFIATNVASACMYSPAWGQAAQQQSYSTYNTPSGELLKNPATRAVLEKHFPGVSGDFRMKMVKGKTFRQLHEMAPDRLPSGKLDAVDRDLRNVAR